MSLSRTAVALALAGLLVTSGCISFLTGEEALTFDSDTVSVDDTATQETGYEQFRNESSRMNRTYAVAGQERNVTVTNHVAEYAKSVSVPLFGDKQVARFTVFATPKVTIAGQGPFNPVSDMNNTQLALLLQRQYTSIDNVQRESERSTTVLGEETTVTKFRADATMVGGQSTEVFFHLTKVEDGDDYVVLLGIYPTQVEEEENVFRMMAGAEHPAGDDSS